MRAQLIYWHKARLQKRFILEMQIYDVGKSQEYKDGVKFRIITIDLKKKENLDG